MRMLLASADLAEVRWALGAGILDGLVTSPALVAQASGDGEEHATLAELARASRYPVYASVRAIDAEDMYRQARELARLGDQMVVLVPLVEDALGVIARLRNDGVRVAAACVFSAAQAVLAAKAGADAVLVSIAPLERYGDDAIATLATIRQALDTAGPECAVLATDVTTTAAFAACAVAGIDGCVLDAAQLRALLVHPLTDRAVDQFLSDLARRPRERR